MSRRQPGFGTLPRVSDGVCNACGRWSLRRYSREHRDAICATCYEEARP